ncbi:hypothetical protein RJ639_003122 [Escallonia herrerae]|uniref:FHA domain-containing protein n=1 Tax=Escallonia herrerae TaxID=1293975 RepID=A0AA89B1A4_9ASTE|nr:hypothetical protein RJ639_003122 [Escallonia herrerae]
MEIRGKDGPKALLNEGSRTEFGRGLVLDSNDRTVSRRHISLQLHSSDLKDGTRAVFEVIGKNPIWVHNHGSGEIRVYKRFERGEMEDGDAFCLSAKKAIWFTVKKIDSTGEIKGSVTRELGVENELADSLQSSHGLEEFEELQLESVDVSHIDPVKEFGFIVLGKEFDSYPKKMIRDPENWDWFLEEHGENSEDEEAGKKERRKGGRRKRKKGEGVDDDEWTGDSEEDKELTTSLRKAQRSKYSTRSKDRYKTIKDTRTNRKSRQKKSTPAKDSDIDDDEEGGDEDDDTLGGFIVDDEEDEVENEEDEYEEEEEDFDEDEEQRSWFSQAYDIMQLECLQLLHTLNIAEQVSPF